MTQVALKMYVTLNNRNMYKIEGILISIVLVNTHKTLLKLIFTVLYKTFKYFVA